MNIGHQASQTSISTDIAVIVLVTGGVFASSLAFERFSHGVVHEWAAQFSHLFTTVMAAIAVYSLLERLIPAGPRKSLKIFIVHLNVGVFYLVTEILAGALAALLAGALSRTFHFGWIDLRFAAGNGVVALMAALLLSNFVFDFFYYWFHRFQHMIPILWQQHKFHHMDEELSAITTLRQHWLEDLFRIPLIALPMAFLFKLDNLDSSSLGVIGAVVGAVTVFWSVFNHANLKLHLGWAGILFAGPQIHRVHHSRLPLHHDRNFAVFFPVWDILFGTFYRPAGDEFPPTGVDGEKEFRTFSEAVIFPFREWSRMLRAKRHRETVST